MRLSFILRVQATFVFLSVLKKLQVIVICLQIGQKIDLDRVWITLEIDKKQVFVTDQQQYNIAYQDESILL